MAKKIESPKNPNKYQYTPTHSSSVEENRLRTDAGLPVAQIVPMLDYAIKMVPEDDYLKLKQEYEELKKQLSVKMVDRGSYVHLTGKDYNIIAQGDPRHFMEDIKRRNVPEHAWCVAIVKDER